MSPVEQAFKMYWRIRDIWNPQTKYLRVSMSWTMALCVDELDDISRMYNGIVFGPSTVCLPGHTCGRRH
jgi:hypothetical protein